MRRHVTSEIKWSRHKEENGYHLGEPFSDVYFTHREAQCMVLLIQGYTNNVVARFLHLSPRTIEFYIKNMRQKTGCASKSHLIKSILKTKFLETVDFSVQDIIM
ncbi:MAG: hypothetical protein A3F17_09355 [Gammaproteobacteria bacterium RIFCSPHIGHO2_12_FULL_41_15]|nr:MAG: hypothetical protein A3F17_09355 [Gammaproteobacteria bacterium RIFCSPHIGHO2_12_FULL_41_15]